MLTMLTTAYADRGRPTLNDYELFRNWLVRDLKEKLKLNLNTIFENNCIKKILVKCVIKLCCEMLLKICNPAYSFILNDCREKIYA